MSNHPYAEQVRRGLRIIEEHDLRGVYMHAPDGAQVEITRIDGIQWAYVHRVAAGLGPVDGLGERHAPTHDPDSEPWAVWKGSVDGVEVRTFCRVVEPVYISPEGHAIDVVSMVEDLRAPGRFGVVYTDGYGGKVAWQDGLEEEPGDFTASKLVPVEELIRAARWCLTAAGGEVSDAE